MRKILIKNYIKAVFMGADGTEHSSQNYANSFTKVEGTGQWSDYETSGYLIAWGIEAQDQSSYTVGIIELPDGTITTRVPDNIKFEEPTQGLNEALMNSEPLMPYEDWPSYVNKMRKNKS